VAVGIGLLAIGGGLYGVGRETSVFAVRQVEIVGGPPVVRHEVRQAVSKLHGTSLLALDGSQLVRTVDALPRVVSVSYDRGFPHTLRLVVQPEQPVAVVRQGAKGWLVSARGRVIVTVSPHAAPQLARIWVPRTTPVAVGGFLPANHATAVARALSLASQFPAHIVFAALRRDGLAFRLRDGLELRLGDPADIRLKLAIARRAMHVLPSGTAYLDVSVPNRPVAGTKPVAGTNPQVSG
jgi:cell division protein FtsQ